MLLRHGRCGYLHLGRTRCPAHAWGGVLAVGSTTTGSLRPARCATNQRPSHPWGGCCYRKLKGGLLMSRTLELSDKAIDEAIAGLSDQLAREAGAFAEVFQSWRRPEVAREVVESLLSGDGETFNALLRPGLDAFSPIRPIVKLSVSPFATSCCCSSRRSARLKQASDTETCRLRTEVTGDERRRYVAIAASFADAEIWEVGAGRGLTALGEDGTCRPARPVPRRPESRGSAELQEGRDHPRTRSEHRCLRPGEGRLRLPALSIGPTELTPDR